MGCHDDGTLRKSSAEIVGCSCGFLVVRPPPSPGRRGRGLNGVRPSGQGGRSDIIKRGRCLLSSSGASSRGTRDIRASMVVSRGPEARSSGRACVSLLVKVAFVISCSACIGTSVVECAVSVDVAEEWLLWPAAPYLSFLPSKDRHEDAGPVDGWNAEIVQHIPAGHERPLHSPTGRTSPLFATCVRLRHHHAAPNTSVKRATPAMDTATIAPGAITGDPTGEPREPFGFPVPVAADGRLEGFGGDIDDDADKIWAISEDGEVERPQALARGVSASKYVTRRPRGLRPFMLVGLRVAARVRRLGATISNVRGGFVCDDASSRDDRLADAVNYRSM